MLEQASRMISLCKNASLLQLRLQWQDAQRRLSRNPFVHQPTRQQELLSHLTHNLQEHMRSQLTAEPLLHKTSKHLGHHRRCRSVEVICHSSISKIPHLRIRNSQASNSFSVLCKMAMLTTTTRPCTAAIYKPQASLDISSVRKTPLSAMQEAHRHRSQ